MEARKSDPAYCIKGRVWEWLYQQNKWDVREWVYLLHTGEGGLVTLTTAQGERVTLPTEERDGQAMIQPAVQECSHFRNCFICHDPVNPLELAVTKHPIPNGVI